VRILLKRQERISLRRPYVGALRPLPSDHPRDYHFHPRRLLPAARYHAASGDQCSHTRGR